MSSIKKKLHKKLSETGSGFTSTIAETLLDSLTNSEASLSDSDTEPVHSADQPQVNLSEIHEFSPELEVLAQRRRKYLIDYYNFISDTIFESQKVADIDEQNEQYRLEVVRRRSTLVSKGGSVVGRPSVANQAVARHNKSWDSIWINSFEWINIIIFYLKILKKKEHLSIIIQRNMSNEKFLKQQNFLN